MACEILVPWLGIEPASSALQWMLNQLDHQGSPQTTGYWFESMVTVSLLLFLYHLCICGCQLYNLVHVCIFSYFCCVQLFVTLRTVVHQAPLSMDSSGKNTGVGCHSFPPPGDLPDPGIKPASLCVSCIANGSFTAEPPEKSPTILQNAKKVYTDRKEKALNFLS